MRTDECSFRDLLESLSPTEWAVIHRKCRRRFNAYLSGFVTDKPPAEAEGLQYLSLSNERTILNGDDTDFITEALIYWLKRRHIQKWSESDVVEAILKKARYLVLDKYASLLKGAELIQNHVPTVLDLDQAWDVPELLEAYQEVQDYLRSLKSVYAPDASRLLEYLFFGESTPENEPFDVAIDGHPSFKPQIITIALGWDDDHFQKVRRFLLKKIPEAMRNVNCECAVQARQSETVAKRCGG